MGLTRSVKVATFLGGLGAALLLAFFFSAAALWARPKQPHVQDKPPSVLEQLKQEYLHLRNTDPQIAQMSEWDHLIEKLLTFADQHSSSPEAASALYDAALLQEQIYHRYNDAARLVKSADLLARLVKKYPRHELADDALIHSADYQLYDFDNPTEARKIFEQIIKNYHHSEMIEVAKARLRSIDNGDYNTWRAAQKATPAPAQRGGRRQVMVVLDPGHGGEDFGARGVGGILEKDVALAIALEAEQDLLREPGLAVKLTRRRDEFIPLAQRIQFANDYEADLFVSIHNNASPKKNVSGLETYYLDNSGDEAARLLAERENAASQAEPGVGSDLQFMLSDLIQNSKLEQSIVLGNMIQRAIVNGLRLEHDRVRDLGVRKAPFYVLVGAHMPCVLTELFFIDHEADGYKLGTKEFRSELAEGLADGILEFIKRQGWKRHE